MEYKYYGTRWLKEGFSFPSLAEYIMQKKNELSAPLKVPEYAAYDEQQRVDQVSEKRIADPYLHRAEFHQRLIEISQIYGETGTLTYQENPYLYDICVFVVDQLMHTVPMICMYEQTLESGLMFNAAAVAYQDQVKLYVSKQLFRENGMFCKEELCYLIGHEVGHAHCHHTYVHLEADAKTSNYEYSADRAGILASTAWILREHPEYSVDAAARLAVLYGASTLLKLGVAAANGPGCTDWEKFDYEALQTAIDSIFRGASELHISTTTHPHDRHRIMAMVHFSQSQLLYRCLGVPMTTTDELYSDKHLAVAMAHYLVNEHE